MPLKFCFLTLFTDVRYTSWRWYTVTESVSRFVRSVGLGMLCWGKLNSEENDSSRENMTRFDQHFHGTRITDVSITEGLATFLRDPDRTVTVVTSQEREFIYSLTP